MKNSIITCLVLGMAVTITGCNKNDGFRIWEGRVLEYGTHKPVDNARVILFKGKSENFGPASFTAVDTVVTTSDGSFSFKYHNEPYAFKIRATAEVYYTNEVSAGNNFPHLQKDIELDPYSWLRLHVGAPNQEVYQIVFHTIGCIPRNFLNGEKEAECICTLRGNRESQVSFNIGILNGNSINETIKPFLPGLDTTYISMVY